jgi:glycosyltransferase involved in cell wall biosynthesis
MQKTDFAFEILVHEDASDDSTAQIVREFEIKYPHLFRCVYQTENQFLKQNTFTNILIPMSRGKYISMCEGDDYWTDSFKLQNQIDFLEKNANYVGCFHNAEERYEQNLDKASFLYCDFGSSISVNFWNLTFRNPIPTCSVIFRKNLFGKIPDWHSKLRMGDWPIHLLNAQYGDYWYVPRVMAVHRLHSKSIWTLQDSELIRKFTIDAYDIMIKGFATKPELQRQLIEAKEIFINPPKYRQPSLMRRGVNYLKRLIK